MKCPNCGTELEDGKLLCEKCGEEIKIVPDYDIELEDTLRESISTLVEDISSQEISDPNLTVDNSKETGPENIIKRNLTIVTIIVAIFVVLSVVMVWSCSDRGDSFDYQYEKAMENAADGNYDEAFEYLERAIELNPDDIDSRFLLAKYYDQNGQRQEAAGVLEEIIADYPQYANSDEVYDTLLGIYLEMGDYVRMGEILKACSIERILTKYNKYCAREPKFNKEGGVYDQVISISITGNTQGVVYYTTDGSTPTSASAVYESPILLESGDYIIRAIFINLYGIESDVVTQNYYINLTVPEAPIVEPESGDYDTAGVMIEVIYDSDTKVYYTTDGTAPTKDSMKYSGALEMPYGVSNFSFVAVDASGLESDVVNRTYKLEIQSNFTPDIAITVLKNSLWALGELSTVEGNVPDKMGINQYNVLSLYGQGEEVYYIVGEEYVDTTGKAHQTSNYYAIDVNNAHLYRAYKLDEGKYNLVAIGS